jgi:4-amino-4-deoxy-L-arabinose transferase-like glycosyltransferase
MDPSARYARAGKADVSPNLEGPEVSPRSAGAALALILGASFALKVHHLDHAAIKPLDEVFHAIVARNFLKHPLTPTLVDRPFLPYDRDDWLANHIWLHKPPLALWQITLSFAILGVNTFALRLPSVILSTLAAGLTYLIGSRLLDRTSGLIAAALQAFNPVILMLTHGYVFSDHVDISLLFWTELSIYFLVLAMESPGRSALVLCGVCQGMAFLSKSFPALIVTLLALVALRTGPTRPGSVKKLLIFLLATVLTIAPWTIWIAIRFPHEFMRENVQILHHLNENIENWAAPWDQVVFNYWISIFHVYYPAIIAAGVIFFMRAFPERKIGHWLILAWAGGVMLPNLLATSKPMCATLIGWPAAWLMFGWLVSSAIKGDRLSLGTWLASMLLAVLFFNRTSIPVGGENWGQHSYAFGTIMRQHLWIVWQVLAALSAGILFRTINSSAKVRAIAVGVSTVATILLAANWWKGNHAPGYLKVAVEVTQINTNSPNFEKIGEFAIQLPPNAAFLVDEQSRLENKLVEFATDRSCYPATSENWQVQARELEQAGALPYLLTPARLPLPIVFVDIGQMRTIYACTPAAGLPRDK